LCQIQLITDAAAAGRNQKPILIGEEEAEFTHKMIASEYKGWFNAKPYFDLIEKETGGDYKL